jgi:hypothetical protein
MATPTIDFEVYLNTNAPAPERQTALVELFANEDAAGIEYAVVMPSPTHKPDNRALYDTAGGERRAILCCQVNPNDGAAALDEIRQAAKAWGMRVLKIMPAIYQVNLTGPRAHQLMTAARELGLVANIHSGSEISHPLAIAALGPRPKTSRVSRNLGGRGPRPIVERSSADCDLCENRLVGRASSAALPGCDRVDGSHGLSRMGIRCNRSSPR